MTPKQKMKFHHLLQAYVASEIALAGAPYLERPGAKLVAVKKRQRLHDYVDSIVSETSK